MAYDPRHYKEQERQVYDRVAPRWSANFSDVTAPYAWRLLDVMSPSPNGRLLDLACGTGELARQAVAAFGCSVEAVDLSDGMLREAERRGTGIAGITYRQGDAEQIAFPDSTFEAVGCAFGVMYFPDTQRALSEIHRVLKPGGRIGFAVWADADQVPALRILVGAMAQVMAPAPLRFLLSLGPLGDRILVKATAREIPGRGPSPFRYGNPADLEAQLHRAGFHDIDSVEHTEVWRYANFEALWTRGAQSTPAHIRPTEEQTALIEQLLEKKARPFRAGTGYAFPMKALLVTATKPI